MRTPIPISNEFAYHISARTPNRELFYIPLNEVWAIMEDYLYLTAKMFCLYIHAFVLMPNHFHLLASTPKLNIGPAMNFFMGENSRAINRVSGRINQNWGRRHHKTFVNSYHYFMNVYKYIYRNPVRAGLCEKVEDYPYSTLSGLCGKSRLIIPTQEDTILFDPNFNIKNLNWLNTPSCPKDERDMRLALKRSIFELPTHPINGKASRLELEWI